MSFVWTNEGRMLIVLSKEVPKSIEFTVKQDGDRRWTFFHYRHKSPVAAFTGENATQALKALKMALITQRLTR